MEPAAPANRALGITLERWFELTSILPLGGYALLHVASYGRVLFGANEVGARTAPSLPFRLAEVLLIWAPLLFHLVVAPWIWSRRRAAPQDGASAGALATMQRLSGVVLGLFLVDHCVRFGWPMVRGERYAADALPMLAAELSSTTLGVPLVAGFHELGTLALAFHLGYGCWRVAARDPRLGTARPTRAVCAGIGLVTALVGTLTVIRLAAG